MSKARFEKVAVLIPCYNEAITIASVVIKFKESLPGAKIYVFDNNSSDNTLKIATKNGAITREVSLQGKGNVIRRMFADIEADIYVLVDGDDTYDANAADGMIAQLVSDGLDMVIGTRISEEKSAYRLGHRFGNVLLTEFVANIFGRSFTDMLSGYRVFSRRYVKSFPAHASGFETETELAIHALELRMPVAEVQTIYKSRPEGSESKLNTYRDGFWILITIVKLFKLEKPFTFFFISFLACVIPSIILAVPLLKTYLITGLVPRIPTAILCAALVLLGSIFLICGIILDTVTRGRTESKRIAYLSIPAPSSLQVNEV